MKILQGVVGRTGLALALLGCASVTPWAQAQNDHLIVPWERIGPVTLGMSQAQLFAVMGDPTRMNGGPPDGVNVFIWRDELSVTVKKNGAYVTQICALSPAYTTVQGARPGATDRALTALLGEPQNSHVYSTWWKQSYTRLFWGGLMVNVPLTGFSTVHVVREICVNHNA
jgi:hypothetical protein